MSSARPLAVTFALAVAAGALGWGSAHRCAQAVPALNDEHPPLADAAPVLLPGGPRLARRVVLVIIDGLRADLSRGLPALEDLRARGASGIAAAGFPTSSAPNYAAILTGVPPRESGVRTNQYAVAVPLDSLFGRVWAAGGRARYLTQLSPAMSVLFPGLEVTLAREDIDRQAVRLLNERSDLVVVLHNAPDEAAHKHGAASKAYLAARLAADRTVAAIASQLDFERDAIVVIADHGHTDPGGHGGTEPEVVEVPFILAGAGVRRGVHFAEATTSDVAPTVAALLGLPAPGHALGHAIASALELDADALAQRDGERIATLLPATSSPLRLAAVAEAGLARGALAAGALVVALVAILWARARRLFIIDGATVRLSALFVSSPAGLLFAALGRLTPSFIAVPEDLPARFATFAAIVVPVLAGVAFGHGAFRSARARLRAAAGVAALALVGHAAIAAALWIFADDRLATTFFDPVGIVVPSLLHAASTCGAAALVVFLVLEGAFAVAQVSWPRRAAG